MKKPVDFFHRRLRFLLHRLVVPPSYPAMLGGAAFPRHLTKPMKNGLRNMQS